MCCFYIVLPLVVFLSFFIRFRLPFRSFRSFSPPRFFHFQLSGILKSVLISFESVRCTCDCSFPMNPCLTLCRLRTIMGSTNARKYYALHQHCIEVLTLTLLRSFICLTIFICVSRLSAFCMRSSAIA